MKQSLDIKLGQHLTITPQLQQAIRLLQLSSLELQQEIQQALEANPLLEEREDDERPEGEAASEEVSAQSKDEAETDSDSDSSEIEMESAELSDDMGMDSDWEEVFDTSTAPNPRSEDGPDLEARNSLPISLRDHLLWQLQMTPLTTRDKSIAMALIDAIDDDGYLKTTLEEIQQALGGEAEVDLSEVEAVLHQIQNFEPAGVAARNLSECLLLQMRGLPADTPNLTQARALIQPEHLDLLAARDQARLRRALKFTPEELTAALTLVQQLNPRPGTGWAHTQSNYIVPDVIVRKVRGIWRAELNADTAPKLRVNPYYEKMVQRGDSSPQNKYLQEHLQEARWFIKSLNSRNDTLLKVARTIVDRQRAFFDHGPEAMKPLVLHDIAQSVQMHESTISRVTTQKYMLTPRGIFELKYFFSSHVGTADGGTCSATAIRSLIKRLVEKEAPSKPISDSKIAEMLEAQGINVARRTVAKYRESLNIPPSSQRKSLV